MAFFDIHVSHLQPIFGLLSVISTLARFTRFKRLFSRYKVLEAHNVCPIFNDNEMNL